MSSLNDVTPRQALVMLAAQGALLTLAGAGFWLWSGRDVANLLNFSMSEVGIGLVFGAALIVTAAAVFASFPKLSERLVRLQSDTYRFLGRDLGWRAIVFISLVAGISEEIALRAGMLTVVADYFGAPIAIVASSALFAMMHLAKPIITVLLFVIGLIFGTVCWQTGSVLAVIIAHVIYDIWALGYLHREMRRLALFDDPAPLANASESG